MTSRDGLPTGDVDAVIRGSALTVRLCRIHLRTSEPDAERTAVRNPAIGAS